MAKCPKCEKSLSSVNVEKLSIKAKPNNWKGIAYTCPWCSTVLSVTMDQVALKNDTADEVLDRLRRG